MKPLPLVPFVALFFSTLVSLNAASPFPGEKADYHGVPLYSFNIGSDKVSVLVPTQPLPAKAWILAPSLYNTENPAVAHMARTELELVKLGFYVVALGPGNTFGAPQAIAKWDAVYHEITETYGLNKKIALMGLSREGLSIARWAAKHPGKVAALYMDKAVCDFKSWPGGKLGLSKGSPKDWASLQELYGFGSEAEALAFKENPVDLAPKLVADKVAIVYVAGDKDDVVPVSENGARMQAEYEKLGGVFKMIHQEAEGHHPHGLENPSAVLNFLQYHYYGNPEPTYQSVSYGPHAKQIVDFWKAPSDKPTPVAVYIHGGGWGAGSHVDPGHVEDYLKAGISVASVEYRFINESTADGVIPPVKGPMSDAARAIQFIRSKSAQWNIRKDRLGLWGGSAGACTSLWLAFHKDLADPASNDPVSRESTRPICVVAQAAQTSLDPQQMKEWTPNSTYGGHAYGVKNFWAPETRETILPWINEYSPYALAASDAPAIFMTYGTPPALGQDEKDPTHTANFGIKLQERLQSLKVESELVYPGAPETKHKTGFEFLVDKLSQP